ncbi:MAG TPA: hypothetical protein VK819_06735 [Acidobacteriaceae bacterium]|nr:hypothetical protein [Acidobacteriaceae bacterium]
MLNRINFAKVVTILAIVFGVSLSLCGLTMVDGNRVASLFMLGIIETVVMVL